MDRVPPLGRFVIAQVVHPIYERCGGGLADLAYAVDLDSVSEANPWATSGSAAFAITDDTTLPIAFPASQRKKVTAAFDGGRITSDGGWPQPNGGLASPAGGR